VGAIATGSKWATIIAKVKVGFDVSEGINVKTKSVEISSDIVG
jgi:hypothetical protein